MKKLVSPLIAFLVFTVCNAQPPQDLPLFSITQLLYEGAFRIDASTYGESSINYCQGPIAYNPQNHSLFIVGHAHDQAIAEIPIPELVLSSNLGDLNEVQAPIQNFNRVLSESTMGNPDNLNRIGGMYFQADGSNGKLIVNAYEYYDADGQATETTLIVEDASNLAAPQHTGFKTFEGGAGHTSGWISEITPAWQALLGGSHITGQSSGIPIISRTSVGPSAFSFDMQTLLQTSSNISTTTLLDFNLSNPLHDDLSNGTLENDLWTHLSRSIYGFIVPGTRTYLTIGNSGGHESGVCYKCTQDNGHECGGYCAPIHTDVYQHFWLWDLNDLLAVKNGSMEPHEIRPYDYGIFETPFQDTEMRRLGGGSFDPVSGILYLNVQRADTTQGVYARPPVIVAYRLDSSLGLEDNTGFDDINIYPNPSEDIVHIQGLSKVSEISMYSVSGQQLFSNITTETNIQVSMKGYSQGVYILKITNRETGESVAKKIVRK